MTRPKWSGHCSPNRSGSPYRTRRRDRLNADPSSSFRRRCVRRDSDRSGSAAWVRGLAAASPDPRILRPDPGCDSDLSPRDAAVNHEGLGHDAAVLRHRLHLAAAPRSSRDDARRIGRDGHAKAHGFRPLTSAPPNARERRHRHGCDTGSGPRTPGARWHDGPLHLAGAGSANRGCCCRVLLRQERLGGDHRAALHETAGQSIVAEEHSPGLSELLHRGQPRRGTRRGDRPPDCGKSCRWQPSHCISPTARTAPT